MLLDSDYEEPNIGNERSSPVDKMTFNLNGMSSWPPILKPPSTSLHGKKQKEVAEDSEELL